MTKRHRSEQPAEDGAVMSEDSYARGAGVGAAADETVAAQDDVVETAEDSAAQGADQAGELAAEREKYLRLAAEYDNFRKRSTRERLEAEARGQAELARALIDALDDIARFAHIDPASTDTVTLVQGVEMVEKKLSKALGAVGLEVVNPVDQSFDPALHEAVATEPAASAEDDHVVARVYQPGYVFKGQLLRPARVVVKQWNG